MAANCRYLHPPPHQTARTLRNQFSGGSCLTNFLSFNCKVQVPGAARDSKIVSISYVETLAFCPMNGLSSKAFTISSLPSSGCPFIYRVTPYQNFAAAE